MLDARAKRTPLPGQNLAEHESFARHATTSCTNSFALATQKFVYSFQHLMRGDVAQTSLGVAVAFVRSNTGTIAEHDTLCPIRTIARRISWPKECDDRDI